VGVEYTASQKVDVVLCVCSCVHCVLLRGTASPTPQDLEITLITSTVCIYPSRNKLAYDSWSSCTQCFQ